MIYHITDRTSWQAAKESGAYRAPSLESEGFIHCSTALQVLKVANAFYRAQPDLIILKIDETALTAELRWEPPAHPEPDAPPPTADSERFPHVYGPVNLDAVRQPIDFPAQADGSFTLPDGVV